MSDNKWTISDKINLGICIFTFFLVIIAGISCYSQIVELRKEADKIESTINLKQDISQNVSFVTQINKEIANLQDMLKQENSLKETEVFHKGDLDTRIKKTNFAKGKNILFLELKHIPLSNSISVSRNDGVLYSGDIPPDAIVRSKNIIGVQYSSTIEHVLEEDNSYYDVAYLPDIQSKELLLTIQGGICKIDDKEGVHCFWKFKGNVPN